MRISRLVLVAILVLVGLAWIGQGSGVIAGSLMSGNRFWAGVGIVLLIAAAVVFLREWTRRSHAAS